MNNFSNSLRSGHEQLVLQDLLNSSPDVLVGVSGDAKNELEKLGILTVFDLGSSWVFANASAVATAAQFGTASNHFGLTPSDWLQSGAPSTTPERLGELGLENLRGVNSADAEALKTALGVATIRELSIWGPYLFAHSLVSGAVGSNVQFEEELTEELRPRFGEYPTERVYYDRLVMLDMGTSNLPTAELERPISLKQALQNTAQLAQRPAVGAMVTLSQSWYAQGITLGHMLHSLALAPGESTRIAVIDWSRRTSASTSESISESERLDSTTQHSRSISEVQSAVAEELQQGGAASNVLTNTQSASNQGSIGSGGLLGLIGPTGDFSSSGQAASSNTQANSSSWSSGSRSVMANMTQDVNDRTQQHSSAVRNRRASAVREVSQSEHEQISTRIVANYNHMHALTVQYYEVVQVYRTVSELHRVERCLFVPMELLQFDEEIVDRYRGALLRAAINRQAASLIENDAASVTVKAAEQTKVVPPSISILTSMNARAVMVNSSRVNLAASSVVSDATTPINAPTAQSAAERVAATPAVAATSLKVWSQSAIASVSNIIGRPILRLGSDDLHYPDETELIAITFDNLNVDRIRLDKSSDRKEFDVANSAGWFPLPENTRLIDLSGISLRKSVKEARTGYITLQLSYFGRRFDSVPIPVDLPLENEAREFHSASIFSNDRDSRKRQLLEHLNANRAYYSNAIFRSLDSGAIVALLSGFQWNGKPLIETVEPRPLTVAGNYLVLRAPVDSDEPSGVGDKTWGELLQDRQIVNNPDHRLIPIPTTGVFAEAVLGRSNSAEKLDITRFWNWQDSPIPLQPTEIAAIQTGSRGQAEDLKPGQLGQPVLNIVNPSTLPDPAGLGAVLSAIQNGNMFRDMSGLAGLQELAKSAQKTTADAATDAGQIASANLRTEAQKQVAYAQIAGDIAKALISKGAAGGSSSVQGISADGAKINHGQNMDQRGVSSAAQSGLAGNSLGNKENTSNLSSGNTPRQGQTTSDGSFEAAAFNEATHGVDPGTVAGVAGSGATSSTTEGINVGTDVAAQLLPPAISTPALDNIVNKFKGVFAANSNLLVYGQFQVAALVGHGMDGIIRNALLERPNSELLNIWKGMWEKGRVDSDALVVVIKSRGLESQYPEILKLYDPDSGATPSWAQQIYKKIWGTDSIEVSPWLESSRDRYRVARQQGGAILNGNPTGELGACFDATKALARKYAKAKSLSPIPNELKISTPLIAGASITRKGNLDQLVYRNLEELSQIITRIKKALDAGYLVLCGVLSGIQHDHSVFPTPEHYLLVFGYEKVDEKDTFVFWDSDTEVSNIQSTGWGSGFGVLFASSDIFSTGFNVYDLMTADANGYQRSFPKRKRYQVYYVQTLPD